MDFAALSNSLKQFMDIFDKSSISTDTVLKNPQENKPSKELVAEFEKYMQEPSEQDGIAPNNGQDSVQDPAKIADVQNTEQVQSVENTSEPVRIQEVQSSEHTEFSADTPEQAHMQTAEVSDSNAINRGIYVEPQEYMQEIQEILTQIGNNSLSPENLFRLQYLTSMLNVQVTQNNSVSKSSTEQFETILKQQG